MADERGSKQEELEGKDKEQEPREKRGSNRKLLFGVLGGVILFNVIIAFALIRLTRPPDREAVEARMAADSVKQTRATETSVGAIVEEPVEAIVNIAGTDGMRFLKVVVRLEYDNGKYKKLGEELTRRLPRLKDLLIEQLSAMTIEELEELDARTQIRHRFVRKVNASLPEEIGQVSNVYLNEFIIQ